MAMNLTGSMWNPLLQQGGNAGAAVGAAVGANVPAAPSQPAAQPQPAPTDTSAQAQQPAAQTGGGAPTTAQGAPAAPTTTPQAPSSQSTGMPQQPQSTVLAQTPPGFSFTPGATMFAQVTGQNQQGAFLLQMGEHLVTAQTDQPLQVGQSVQLQVQGGADGQVQMQLVETPFAQIDSGELANSLTELNLPVTESSMELAQSMVEHGMPLTGESFTNTMAQTALPPNAGPNPPPIDSRVSAVVFLQQNALPVTGENMMLLSNFLASNPALGAQLFAVNGELQKLQKTLDRDSLEMLEEITGVLGEGGALDEARSPGQPAQPATPPKLYNMAKQAGIENNWSNLYGTDDDKPDIASYLRERRSTMSDEEGLGKLAGLMKGIEDNLDAQKLINQAHPLQDLGYYYFQIPFSLFNRDGAQVWVRYEKKRNGRKDVDPDETCVEFLVTTEHLGDMFFGLELRQGTVSLEVSTSGSEARALVKKGSAVLVERIEALGYKVGRLNLVQGPPRVKHELVERTALSSVQSCNVSA